MTKVLVIDPTCWWCPWYEAEFSFCTLREKEMKEDAPACERFAEGCDEPEEKEEP